MLRIALAEVAGSAARWRAAGGKLVGAEDDGAEVVELLDFGRGDGAIVDADVVD